VFFQSRKVMDSIAVLPRGERCNFVDISQRTLQVLIATSLLNATCRSQKCCAVMIACKLKDFPHEESFSLIANLLAKSDLVAAIL
jgi:hypothetical protein